MSSKSLEKEIVSQSTVIQTDGYDMSFGEIMNLYEDGELVISPDFQRLYRWESYQKSKFIESILLGIPLPPIFVFQDDDNTWELVDGLQRLSTLLEFSGKLRGPDGKVVAPTALIGTKRLPSLEGKMWAGKGEDALPRSRQIAIKRSRIPD